MSVGLNAAVSGLMAAQRALDVASHNISNSDTPGYSRQTMQQDASAPLGAGGLFMRYGGVGQVGTGVSVTSITRVRNQYLDAQFRNQSAPLGEAQVTSDTLKQVQNIFDEPSNNGLASQLQQFWNGWQSLANNPEDLAVRTNLQSVSASLAGTFNDVFTKLTNLRQDVNDQIQSKVNDINTLTSQIASLNGQIIAGLNAGQNPNDLEDARDQAINQLSQKIGINVVQNPTSGALNVFLNGQPLVDEKSAFQLQAAPVLTNGFFQINYAPTGQQAQVGGGELNALLNLRNNTLSDTQPGGFISDLNGLCSNLMSAVNTIHTASFGLDGVTTLPFFTGTNAADIQVNPAIMAQPDGIRLIAAATNDPGSLSGGPADNGAALKIADLQNQVQSALGNNTFDGYYQNIITSAGTQGQQSSNQLNTQQQLVQAITQQQQTVSGVNSDEEMANVVTAQKAYEAAARVMSTIDQMMQTLMNIQ